MRIVVVLVASLVAALAAAGGVDALGSASGAFTDAPASQSNDGVVTSLCPLAASNRYLPARAGCVEVRRAGRDLVILYSVLTDEHPSYIGLPNSLKGLYVAKRAYLEVVQPNGGAATTPLREPAAAILSVAHGRVLLEIGRTSSGQTAEFYAFSHGRLLGTAAVLGWGGDSADRAGFSCTAGTVVSRTYALLGPTIYAWWRETEITYHWRGPELVRVADRSFKRRGLPSGSAIAAGRGCL